MGKSFDKKEAEIDFFSILYKNNEFCEILGRCALACSRLESALIRILKKNGITNIEKLPLGALARKARKNHLLENNTLKVLEDITDQRNHMMHRIYSLFSYLIEEDRLPRSNIIDSDIWTYIDCASQLQENIDRVADILEKENASKTSP